MSTATSSSSARRADECQRLAEYPASFQLSTLPAKCALSGSMTTSFAPVSLTVAARASTSPGKSMLRVPTSSSTSNSATLARSAFAATRRGLITRANESSAEAISYDAFTRQPCRGAARPCALAQLRITRKQADRPERTRPGTSHSTGRART